MEDWNIGMMQTSYSSVPLVQNSSLPFFHIDYTAPSLQAVAAKGHLP
jgi:hypothetical protein